MFEREIKDVQFIKRWGIVRTLFQQNVAEHTFCVAMYANDICVYFGLDERTHLRVLQRALWHDVDEIFTSDIPGPSKRAIVSDRAGMKNTLRNWMRKVFGVEYSVRAGMPEMADTIADLVVKLADNMDAAMQMGIEYQIGNAQIARQLVEANTERAKITAYALMAALAIEEHGRHMFIRKIDQAIAEQCQGSSMGPRVTGEDDKLAPRTS